MAGLALALLAKATVGFVDKNIIKFPESGLKACIYRCRRTNNGGFLLKRTSVPAQYYNFIILKAG